MEELLAQTTEAVATIDVDMIQRILDKTAYRLEICHMTQGNNTEYV
jgi:hypothetical protein